MDLLHLEYGAGYTYLLYEHEICKKWKKMPHVPFPAVYCTYHADLLEWPYTFNIKFAFTHVYNRFQALFNQLSDQKLKTDSELKMIFFIYGTFYYILPTIALQHNSHNKNIKKKPCSS